MKLLVTVGTHKFEKLTHYVLKNALTLLTKYETITLQTGIVKIAQEQTENLHIYQFIDEIDYSNYDVILCHCGTGSILGGLRAGKTVVAVVNEELKDNHQLETAEVFKLYVNVVKLENVLECLMSRGNEACPVKLKEKNNIINILLDQSHTKKGL